MVITVLEGAVPEPLWQALREEYAEQTKHLPPQMVETFLVHGASEPTSWQVISIWKSREALEEMRRSAETPGGVLVFRAAAVTPRLTILDVIATKRP